MVYGKRYLFSARASGHPRRAEMVGGSLRYCSMADGSSEAAVPLVSVWVWADSGLVHSSDVSDLIRSGVRSRQTHLVAAGSEW